MLAASCPLLLDLGENGRSGVLDFLHEGLGEELVVGPLLNSGHDEFPEF